MISGFATNKNFFSASINMAVVYAMCSFLILSALYLGCLAWIIHFCMGAPFTNY